MGSHRVSGVDVINGDHFDFPSSYRRFSFFIHCFLCELTRGNGQH